MSATADVPAERSPVAAKHGPPRIDVPGRGAAIGTILVASAAVAILVVLGSRQYVSYDSYWHVFVARQETWGSFWREVKANAHPPLYYLVLKVAIILLGNGILAYRVVSIAAVAAAILVFGRIAARLTANAPLAIAATAAFGLSTSVIEIGLEARSYALLLAFMVAALDAYVSWLDDCDGSASMRHRVGFATFASLALLSHYCAFFFVFATAITPAILSAIDGRWRVRIRREIAGHAVSDGIMFGVPLALGMIAYRLHVHLYPDGFGHVLPFLRDRNAESALAFAARTTRSLALLFLPGRWESSTAPAAAAAALFIALAWAALRNGSRGDRAAVPFVLLFVMAGANLVTGITRRYPYGGWMRHEIFLLPFLVLCLFVGMEAVRRSAAGRWAHRGAWGGAAFAIVATLAVFGIARFPVDPQPLGQSQIELFRRKFPAAPAVLVDQYNSISLFALHHDWSWHLQAEWPGQRRVWQVWSLSRGTEHFTVCRDEEWQLDFSKSSLYDDVAECLSVAGTAGLAVYRPQQWGEHAKWNVAETEALAASLSAAAGVEATAVIIEGEDVYASFTRRAPRGAAAGASIP